MSQSIDAQAADNFGGVHNNRRAGYTDPLGWALKTARKGGTLAAGEGKMLIEYYEEMLRAAFIEGWHSGHAAGNPITLLNVRMESFDAWERADIRREAERR